MLLSSKKEQTTDTYSKLDGSEGIMPSEKKQPQNVIYVI